MTHHIRSKTDHVFYWISVFILLMFSGPVFAADKSELLPCWVQSPQLDDNHHGFIGVAARYSVKKYGSLIAARRNALQRLAVYEQLNLREFTADEILLDSLTLENGISVYWSDSYVDEGELYVLAIPFTAGVSKDHLVTLTQNTCPRIACDFKRCEPQWLCGKLRDHKGANVIGVSQLTVNPSQQYQQMLRNGSELMAFLHGSYVTSQQRFSFSSDGQIEHSEWRDSSNIISKSTSKVPLRAVQQCWSQNYLFSWLKMDSPHPISYPEKSFSQWLRDPEYQGAVGVVGIFDGYVASGRFSDKIMLSIKDAMVELANTKGINVLGGDILLQNQQGRLFASVLNTSSSTVVSARILDIQLTEQNNKLVIYTWLVNSEEI